MAELLVGCVGLVLLLLLFLTGIELAFAMTAVGFLGFAYLRSVHAAVNLLGKDYFDAFASYAFTVVPLFVLMGQAASNSGMAEELYKTARKFVGHVPGGLALATVVGATFFKAISGSTLATAATFSSVAIPEMDKYGYSRRLSTGIVASVGTLGVLIPPSGVMIIMAMITEQSIGTLFLAGTVPGLLIALLFLLVILVWCRIDPALGPKGPVFAWRERTRSLPQVVWPLLIFCIVIGGLLKGLFTPTEAGSAGAIAVVALTMAKRDLDTKGLIVSISESLRMGCMVLMLIAGSAVLGHFITVTKIPAVIAEWAVTLPLPPKAIMAVIVVIYLVGGSFIDDMAFMILATPIFFPVAMKLGFDPVWFAVCIGVTLMIGVVIPPVAVSVFIVKSITGESIGVVYRGVLPFLLSLLGCLVLLFLFPDVATWLPRALE
ncbi:MAG: TRAP transporter large permease [Deltaproteobacteria bacterium]|nr:TRAP transporter large permease [Deltaproteobacteria bacterium]